VVFDPYSGETHYLNPLVSAIYRRIVADSSVELGQLCEALTRAGDDEAEEITTELIGSAAARLRFIGLVEILDDET